MAGPCVHGVPAGGLLPCRACREEAALARARVAAREAAELARIADLEPIDSGSEWQILHAEVDRLPLALELQAIATLLDTDGPVSGCSVYVAMIVERCRMGQVDHERLRQAVATALGRTDAGFWYGMIHASVVNVIEAVDRTVLEEMRRATERRIPNNRFVFPEDE